MIQATALSMSESNIDLTELSNQNLSMHLIDIRIPESIGWWPLAPGWLMLIAVVAIAVAWSLRGRIGKSKSGVLRHEATQIFDQLQTDGDVASYCHRMTSLLRKTAVNGDVSRSVGSLHGAEWVCWLEDSVGVVFSTEARNLLCDECYRESPAFVQTAVHSELANWLTQYKRMRRQQGKTSA